MMSPMASMGGAQPMQPGMSMAPPQPPTPEQMALVDKPSWEEVIGLLRDKAHRSYRIDIETDSTIAGSLESDMSGLAQIMQAIAGFMRETEPLVQSGMLPVEAQKEMLMAITRRARMGMVVEDALDKMRAPKPSGPDPAIQVAQAKAQADAQKFQAEQQAAQQKMQMQQQFDEHALQMQAQADERAKQVDFQLEQQRIAMEAQAEQQRQRDEMAVEQSKQAAQAQQNAHQNQLEAERETLRHQNEMQLEALRMQMEEREQAYEKRIELIIAQMNNATKLEVAQIGKRGGLLSAEQISTAEFAADDAGVD